MTGPISMSGGGPDMDARGADVIARGPDVMACGPVSLEATVIYWQERAEELFARVVSLQAQLESAVGRLAQQQYREGG